jgi:predicted transposase/invertase (TIGR01784 family)
VTFKFSFPGKFSAGMTYADRYRLRAEDRQEGILQGMQQGVQRGVQQGREQARQETTKAIALRLIKQGLNFEQIAVATGLSTEELNTLKSC